MCTVSWHHRQGGFKLFFNRDEQRSRARADAPEARLAPNGTPFLAPLDPDGGGTWIFLNAAGVCAVLLNTYGGDGTERSGVPRSRGLLLADLTVARDRNDLAARLGEAVWQHPYHPCLILAIDAHGAVLREWTGGALRAHPLPRSNVLATSSVNPAGVAATRKDRFAQIMGRSSGREEDKALAFHFLHDPSAPAESPLMARTDARTVSVTGTEVEGRGRAHMHYREIHDGYPPVPGPAHARDLAFRENASAHGCNTRQRNSCAPAWKEKLLRA